MWWGPSKLGDLMEEASLNIEEEQKGFSILHFLADIVIQICYNIHRMPPVYLQIISFILAINFMQFLGLVLAFVFYGLSYSIALGYHSWLTIRDILNYLDHDLVNKSQIEGLVEYSIEDYLAQEQIEKIKACRIVSWAPENIYPISRVFVINQKLGIVAGQRKGFVVPMGYRIVNQKITPYPLSIIFLTDSPDEVTLSSKFYVYHEIGHTTKRAWRVKTRPYLFVVATLPLWLYIPFNTNSLLWSLLFLFLYTGYRFFLEVSTFFNELDDETIADTFAIRNFPANMSMLQKILEKAFQQNKNFWDKQINKNRMENINKLINKRENGLNFSNFDISRKITIFHVEILGILFALSIVPLHAPSLSFIIVLFLSCVALMGVVSIISWQLLMLSDHLEECLKKLTVSHK